MLPLPFGRVIQHYSHQSIASFEGLFTLSDSIVDSITLTAKMGMKIILPMTLCHRKNEGVACHGTVTASLGEHIDLKTDINRTSKFSSWI